MLGIKSFSSTSSGKGGVSLIFFHPSTVISSTQVLIPNYAILVKSKIKDQELTFINTYIPPGNSGLREKILNKISHTITSHKDKALVIMGDFNMRMKGSDSFSVKRKKASKILKPWVQGNNLVDSFRKQANK